MVIEVLEHSNRWPLAHGRHGAWHKSQGSALTAECLEQRSHSRFPFAFQHAIDRAFGMLEDRLRNERGAMSSDEDPTSGQQLFGQLGKIDDLRHICEIIARKPDDVRPLFM